jgi:Skp family chaperone for outer membrane proteins
MQSKKFVPYLIFGMVILTLILAAGSFSKTAVSAKAPDSTVGYVNMELIQKELPDYIDLADVAKYKEAELTQLKSLYNIQLEGASRDLKNKAEKEKAGKSSEEQAKIEQKYQEQLQVKFNDLNNQLNQKAKEINEYLNQQKAAVMEKLQKTIEAVATDMKLTLVLDKNACLYGGVDITQKVLDQAKANSKTDSKTTNSKSGK